MARLPGSKYQVAPETEEPNGQESQRERIYRAAVASFDARGINRASMEKVAQQAGVSRQTVYFYFPDKVSLIAEVVLRHAREWLAEISEQLEDRPGGVQPIVEAMVLCVDGARRDAYLALLLRPTSDKLATALASMPAVREAQEALWYPLFRRARESGELRADRSDDELMAWITLVGLAIMTHGSERGLDDLTKVDSLLNQFMVPSLHRQAEHVVSPDPAGD